MSRAGPDALVIFGITGDLARQMTFRSLYRLEQRGLLDFPIIGVARQDLDDGQLRSRARESLIEQREDLEEEVFTRLARRLRYVRGDFEEDTTYRAIADAVPDVHSPALYLETPPSLFARVVGGLGEAGLLRGGYRVLVEKPFGHDLASARELAAELHRHLDESRLYRIDHFLGKLGLEELLYLRFANATLEPVWNSNYVTSVQLTMAENLGLEQRGSFYDPVGQLRDDVVNHLMQLLAAAAMEAPAGADAATLQDAKRAVFRAIQDADPNRYIRGQYQGYLDIDGVAPDSRTETYVALELHIDNWRWAGVPFLIRTGKGLPVTRTELRLIFKRPPRPLFIHDRGHRPPQPGQLVVTLDPTASIRMLLDVHQPDRGGPQQIPLQIEFPPEGDGAPTPYELLLAAALRGERTRFTRQDNVEECWRIVQPLLDNPGPVHPYPQGSWGPHEAQQIAAPYGGWRDPRPSDER